MNHTRPFFSAGAYRAVSRNVTVRRLFETCGKNVCIFNGTREICQNKFCSSAFKSYHVSRKKEERLCKHIEVKRADCMPLTADYPW